MITSSSVVYALIFNRTPRIINTPITNSTSKRSKIVIKPMIQTPTESITAMRMTKYVVRDNHDRTVMKRRFVKPRVTDLGEIKDIVQMPNTVGGSSRRWKMNIKPIGDALSKVRKLRGVSFDWKDSGRHDIGLIAEDTGKIVPEVVTYEENGVNAKGIDYGHLVGLIVEAVKEQQRMIEEQRKEIQELKAAAKILAARQTNTRINALT